MKNGKKINIHTLVSDNRFIFACSLVIAVIFWAAVCISFSPETQVVIEDVPISIEMENSVPAKYGLQMFGEGDYSVDITVTGSRYVVGNKLLTKNDFIVTADTSSVTSAGTHALQVKVVKKNPSGDFTIDDVSESYINIYFDEKVEKQAKIEAVVSSGGDIVEEGYLTDDNYIMSEETVLVSGPAIEIAQLKKVVANVEIDKPLTKSQAFSVPLTALGANGASLKYTQIDGADNAAVSVTVPVYKMTTLPVEISFYNSPGDYVDAPFDYTCSPSRLNIAVLQNGTDQQSIVAGKVDFSHLKSGSNTFEFDVKDIVGVKKESTSVQKITVTVNVADVKSRTVSLLTSNLSFKNAPEDYTVSVLNERIGNVTVYGPESELSAIDPEKLTFSVNLASVSIEEGYNEIETPLVIKGSGGCWICGTYTLDISAKANQ